MSRPQRDANRERLWRRHLKQQRSSGLTVRAFCSLHQLKETSFFFWKKEIAKRDREAAAAAPPPAFVSVSIVEPPAPRHETPIDICLAEGPCVRVRSGCDRQLLADVLAMLARPIADGAKEVRPC
ncbi:MAG TPA: hypothetical protein VGI99_03340 [Gemmataceae bacterium]|jgi:hypothetical protein